MWENVEKSMMRAGYKMHSTEFSKNIYKNTLEGVVDIGGWFRVSGVFRFLLCFLSIRTF